MSRRPFASMLPYAVLSATLMAACSTKNKAGQGDQPAPTNPAAPAPSTLSADQEQELNNLPMTVLIGVRPGDDASSADMRVPGANLTDLNDSDAALRAFESGLSVKVSGSQDELDRGSSTASWAPYSGKDDYTSYAPKAYSKVQSGYTYDYNHVGLVNVAGLLIHIFQRPGGGGGSYGGYGNNNGGYGGGGGGGNDYDSQLAGYFKTFGVYAVTDGEYAHPSQQKVALGSRLFYDTKLSTNGGVSCASCHLTSQGTANVYSLPATGFVIDGTKKGPLGAQDILPRNTPGLFNLGHSSYTTMFWDSRVAVSASAPGGYFTPAGSKTPLGLDSALAAQALFPIASGNEMAGCALGAITANSQSIDPTPVWSALMTRLLASADYQSQFAAAFPEVTNGNFGIEHLANAIAAFEGVTWRADKSPFDNYLRGDLNALTPDQKRGATYFYGKGKCGGCHSGPFQTDHNHHAVGVVQFGPGANAGSHGWEDLGVGGVSGSTGDNYQFRTPPLRNTAMTGPWGHDGAYSSLREFVEHYKNPVKIFDSWNPKQVILPAGVGLTPDVLGAWTDHGARDSIKHANQFPGVDLSPDEVDGIVLFLQALTDPTVAQNSHTLIK